MNIANAAEHGAETTQNSSESPLGNLGINGTLFVFQAINFALVALILWHLILKPLTNKMTERQKLIDESIDQAKRIQENLLKSEKEYQARIDQAKVDANKIIEKATVAAEESANELRINAKVEIEKLVSQARANIKVEKETMKKEVLEETSNLIILALEKILSEKMNSEKDSNFIESVIGKLKK